MNDLERFEKIKANTRRRWPQLVEHYEKTGGRHHVTFLPGPAGLRIVGMSENDGGPPPGFKRVRHERHQETGEHLFTDVQCNLVR